MFGVVKSLAGHVANFLFTLTMTDPGQGGRQLVGSSSSGDLASPIANLLWNNVFPAIMACCIFACVLAMMINGTRLAASGIFQDPRGRMMSVIGLISAAVGTLICVNAQPLVAICCGISITPSAIMLTVKSGAVQYIRSVLPGITAKVTGFIGA